MKKLILLFILSFLLLHSYHLNIYNNENYNIFKYYNDINYSNMKNNTNNKSDKKQIYVTKNFKYYDESNKSNFNFEKLKLVNEKINNKIEVENIVITKKENNEYSIKLHNLLTYCDKLSSSYLIENYNNLGFTLNLLPNKIPSVKSFFQKEQCNHSIEFEISDVLNPNDNLFILINGELKSFILK